MIAWVFYKLSHNNKKLFLNILAGFRLAGPFCGYILPNEVIIPYSSASVVNVTFTSDNIIQYEGFAIEVAFETGINHKN